MGRKINKGIINSFKKEMFEPRGDMSTRENMKGNHGMRAIEDMKNHCFFRGQYILATTRSMVSTCTLKKVEASLLLPYSDQWQLRRVGQDETVKPHPPTKISNTAEMSK